MSDEMSMEEYVAGTEREPFTAEFLARSAAIAVTHARKAMRRFEEADGDEARLGALPGAAAAAYHLGDFARAGELAGLALKEADGATGAWWHGNAIHSAHTVRGLLALDAGDVDAAVAALHAAGDTPGSPQLNSFGPTMHLARALLERGRKDDVLAYLAQCRRFWRMGTLELGLWENMVREGRIPNFFQHTHVR